MRYENLIQGLENIYEGSQVKSFPVSLKEAYKIMIEYRECLDNSKRVFTAVETGVAFSQGRYYKMNPIHAYLTCKICGVKVHINTDCK